MKTEDLQPKLEKFLMKHQRTLGRDGKVVLKMAENTGLSKHTIQSIAMGRRAPSSETVTLLANEMKKGYG